ncbi:MAG: high-affinity nickel-transport family protein [Elusimicrobia bacterium]|nr:high-affinity nickel-transport family protein [Elusimicrobiota bacterium]
MTSLGLAVTLGFVLGLRHAMDPDHIVAVSTFVSRGRRFGSSWLLGACWGLGHTATVFIAGAPVILLKWTVPPTLESGLELVVGMMLVALGVANLRSFLAGAGGAREHSHEHAHGDPRHRHHVGGDGSHGGEAAHVHPHAHSPALEALRTRIDGRLGLRSFSVGVVHGLAGSSAIALMVPAAIPEPRAGLAYLAVFGLGTLVGMVALSALMEWGMLRALARWRAERWLVSGSGAVSLAIGLYIMYRSGRDIWPLN